MRVGTALPGGGSHVVSRQPGWALVTGATSGIGEAAALALAEAGAAGIVVTGRDADCGRRTCVPASGASARRRKPSWPTCPMRGRQSRNTLHLHRDRRPGMAGGCARQRRGADDPRGCAGCGCGDVRRTVRCQRPISGAAERSLCGPPAPVRGAGRIVNVLCPHGDAYGTLARKPFWLTCPTPGRRSRSSPRSTTLACTP